MRRRLLHVAAAFSLMLMLATVLAWTWLGRFEQTIAYVRPNSQIVVGAFPNAIIMERSVVTWSLYPGWEVGQGNFKITLADDVGTETDRHVRLHSAGGTAIRWITRTLQNKAGGPPHQRFEFGLWIPYWLLLVLTLPLPLWVLTIHQRRFVRDSRRERGQCEHCGYDLRGTPDCCPECGAIPEAPHNPPMQRTGRETL